MKSWTSSKWLLPVALSSVVLGCSGGQEHRATARTHGGAGATSDSSVTPRSILAEAEANVVHHEMNLAYSEAQRLIVLFPAAPEAVRARAIAAFADSVLSIAGAQAGAQREAALKQALKGMARKHDAMRDIDIWRDNNFPAYVNTRSAVGAYFVGGSYAPSLTFVIYYVADDWLFIQRYLIKVDGRTWEFTPSENGTDAVERDNGEGGIWEWWHTAAEGDKRDCLEALANGKEATVRYEGQHYYRDRKIGPEERAAIRRTLAAFEALRSSGLGYSGGQDPRATARRHGSAAATSDSSETRSILAQAEASLARLDLDQAYSEAQRLIVLFPAAPEVARARAIAAFAESVLAGTGAQGGP